MERAASRGNEHLGNVKIRNTLGHQEVIERKLGCHGAGQVDRRRGNPAGSVADVVVAAAVGVFPDAKIHAVVAGMSGLSSSAGREVPQPGDGGAGIVDCKAVKVGVVGGVTEVGVEDLDKGANVRGDSHHGDSGLMIDEPQPGQCRDRLQRNTFHAG